MCPGERGSDRGGVNGEDSRRAGGTSPSPDACRNYHGGVEESVLANESIHPRKHAIRADVHRFIRLHPGGVTCEKVENDLGLKHQTASARITELLAGGAIHVARVRGRTSSGRTARVYLDGPEPRDPRQGELFS